MTIPFFKMHGTGNDFIVIDNRPHLIQRYAENNELVARLCHRQFGIGADGLILINNKAGFHFDMVYFNADGFEGSMCGNGGRCAIAVADMLNLGLGTFVFTNNDKIYKASIIKKKDADTFVRLSLNDVTRVKRENDYIFADTGSPHHVIFTDNVNETDVVKIGRDIRYSNLYGSAGSNVNFVQWLGDSLFVRTYERGVEDETLSCGTGVTASAIAAFINGYKVNNNDYPIQTKGGNLRVKFRYNGSFFSDVILEGPATMVYKGEIDV